MALDFRTRFETEAGRNPEWRPWLRLLELTHVEAQDDVWSSADVATSARARGESWLHGATVSVDPLHAGDWIRRLLSAAASEDLRATAGHARIDSVVRVLARDFDPLFFLGAAIRQDVAMLGHLADLPPGECGALAAVSQLAVTPLLLACGRMATQAGAMREWHNGWCPVCAAWPAFAELRGLDRTRNLRCGRCAADWSFSVLRCPFCDEKDHRALGGLVPAQAEATARVDVCRTCNGYLKGITVLRATPSWAVPLEDLSTVPLDIAAHDRGFERPAQPTLRMAIRLAAARPPLAVQ